MSSVSVAVVSGAAFMAPLAIGGAVVGLAGYGCAHLAYAMAQQLQKDYAAAKAEMQSRCAAEDAARTTWVEEAANRKRDADEFVVAIRYTTTDATADYVHNRLNNLISRANAASDLGLVARGAELLVLAEQGAESVLNQVLSYAEKVDNVAARSIFDAVQAEHSGALELLFGAFEQELEDSKLAVKQHFQQECGNQLIRLRKLGASQPKVALQGLSLLQAKTRRLIRESLKAEAAAQKENAHRRDVVTEVVAKLRAVAACPSAPVPSALAKTTMQDLATFLIRPDTGSRRQLESFLIKAEALFAQCQQSLDAAVTSAIVQETVCEALLQRGYTISQVPAEADLSAQEFLLTLNDQLGLAFSVDASGCLRTEAVAFTDSAAKPDEAAEETVCKLVDEIYLSLRTKGAEVREQGRRRRNPGERLRVVEPRTKVTLHQREETSRKVRP